VVWHEYERAGFILLLLTFLLFMLILLLTMCAPATNDEDCGAEAAERESFIRDLVSENTAVRNDLNALRDTLMECEVLALERNETLVMCVARLQDIEDVVIAPSERKHQFARVPIEKIRFSPESVTINLPGVTPVTLADTNSMDPIADANAKVLVVKPAVESDLHVGDIIGYHCSTCNETEIVMHRITAIAQDAQGVYYTLKGDNNPEPDPDRVRFTRVVTVVVAIVY